ncbi:unnamed protein product [Plutella xylostella]|uniref:(diamondback moth) hypothetical protein n=1 Tax=Plutella xylostella TaxID=51655 RepID=A0A8S4FL73_PLUXY|nr:unnamed protein product [Plutella xylostella]
MGDREEAATAGTEEAAQGAFSDGARILPRLPPPLRRLEHPGARLERPAPRAAGASEAAARQTETPPGYQRAARAGGEWEWDGCRCERGRQRRHQATSERHARAVSASERAVAVAVCCRCERGSCASDRDGTRPRANGECKRKNYCSRE